MNARNKEYKKYLINRGYNKKYVKRQFEEVQSIPRDDLQKSKQHHEEAKKFPLVLDFNPRLPNVGKTIRDHMHLLHASPTLVKFYQKYNTNSSNKHSIFDKTSMAK